MLALSRLGWWTKTRIEESCLKDLRMGNDLCPNPWNRRSGRRRGHIDVPQLRGPLPLLHCR